MVRKYARRGGDAAFGEACWYWQQQHERFRSEVARHERTQKKNRAMVSCWLGLSVPTMLELLRTCTALHAAQNQRKHGLPHACPSSPVVGVECGEGRAVRLGAWRPRAARVQPRRGPRRRLPAQVRHRGDGHAARGEGREATWRGARGGVKWERAAPGRRAQSRPCAHLLRTRLLRGVRGEGAARSNIVSLLSRLSCLSHVSLMSPLCLPSFPTRSAPAARRDCSHLSLSTLRFSSQLSRSRRSSSAALYAASASLRRGVKRGRGR